MGKRGHQGDIFQRGGISRNTGGEDVWWCEGKFCYSAQLLVLRLAILLGLPGEFSCGELCRLPCARCWGVYMVAATGLDSVVHFGFVCGEGNGSSFIIHTFFVILSSSECPSGGRRGIYIRVNSGQQCVCVGYSRCWLSRFH